MWRLNTVKSLGLGASWMPFGSTCKRLGSYVETSRIKTALLEILKIMNIMKTVKTMKLVNFQDTCICIYSICFLEMHAF